MTVRAIGIAAVAVVVLAACGGGADPVGGEAQPDMDADRVVFGLEHVVTVDGVKRAVLYADTAFMYDDSARVELRVVRLELSQPEGTDAATLTSRRGRLNRDTQRMFASGDVVLVTVEGDRRIETEELHYDPRADSVWSDVPTMLHQDETTIRGDGFTSDGRLHNLKVRNPTGRFEGLELEM